MMGVVVFVKRKLGSIVSLMQTGCTLIALLYAEMELQQVQKKNVILLYFSNLHVMLFARFEMDGYVIFKIFIVFVGRNVEMEKQLVLNFVIRKFPLRLCIVIKIVLSLLNIFAFENLHLLVTKTKFAETEYQKMMKDVILAILELINFVNQIARV